MGISEARCLSLWASVWQWFLFCFPLRLSQSPMVLDFVNKTAKKQVSLGGCDLNKPPFLMLLKGSTKFTKAKTFDIDQVSVKTTWWVLLLLGGWSSSWRKTHLIGFKLRYKRRKEEDLCMHHRVPGGLCPCDTGLLGQQELGLESKCQSSSLYNIWFYILWKTCP